ncbi:MAG: N-acetylmuramoyl-L-alanine amidase [Calditrichia bacterium]
MKIEQFMLKGDTHSKVKFVESPNSSGELKADTIVIHYTAGRDADSSVKTLCDPNARASAHLVVGRTGEIYQLVPFNKVAWHAGQSEYHLPDGTTRSGYNKYSIGIEIDNAGPLTKSGDKYVSWFGRAYEENEVFYGTHRNETTPRYWHRFTEDQIFLVQEICTLLVREYNLKFILGHEEISPKRKTDPGPAFPLDKMRERILNPSRNQDEPEPAVFPADGTVTASKLNIRSQPSVAAEKIAQPLPQGKKIKIIKEMDGWYEVAVEIQGYVTKQFVEIKK